MTDFTSALGGTFIDPFRDYKRTTQNSGGAAAASRAAMKSAAGGVGSMVGVVAKGTLVDTPLAFAEGFRNLPRLYGEETKDHGRVTGWQSGGVVAAKVTSPRRGEAFCYADCAHRHSVPASITD